MGTVPSPSLKPFKIKKQEIRRIFTENSGPAAVVLSDPAGTTYELSPKLDILRFVPGQEKSEDWSYRPHVLDRIQGNKMVRLFVEYLGIEDATTGKEALTGREWLTEGAIVGLSILIIYGDAAGSIKFIQNGANEIKLFVGAAQSARTVRDFLALQQYQRIVDNPTSFRVVPKSGIYSRLIITWSDVNSRDSSLNSRSRPVER